jgi:MFS family permease
MEVLVAARAVAGLGAGGLQSLSQITIGDIFAPQERGRWIGVIMSVFGLALFVWQELRSDEPILSPAFFKSGIFIVCMLATFCVALGMYGSIMFVPLFVQGIVGTSAQDSGVVLTPMMIGFVIGSTVSGQLVSRWGRYRILALVGLAIASVGLFLFGLMTVHTTNLEVIRNMVVLGVGIGSTMPLFTIAVQNAFPHRVLGQVTATRQFFLSLGGAVASPSSSGRSPSASIRSLRRPLSRMRKRMSSAHRSLSACGLQEASRSNPLPHLVHRRKRSP